MCPNADGFGTRSSHWCIVGAQPFQCPGRVSTTGGYSSGVTTQPETGQLDALRVVARDGMHAIGGFRGVFDVHFVLLST
jgi:hypothetical protein